MGCIDFCMKHGVGSLNVVEWSRDIEMHNSSKKYIIKSIELRHCTALSITPVHVQYLYSLNTPLLKS